MIGASKLTQDFGGRHLTSCDSTGLQSTAHQIGGDTGLSPPPRGPLTLERRLAAVRKWVSGVAGWQPMSIRPHWAVVALIRLFSLATGLEKLAFACGPARNRRIEDSPATLLPQANIEISREHVASTALQTLLMQTRYAPGTQFWGRRGDMMV